MRIKQVREEKGVSQRQLAEIVGVSAVTVLNWENGIYDPSAKDLIKLSKALDASIDYLVGNDSQDNEKEAVRRALNRLSKEELIELIVSAIK